MISEKLKKAREYQAEAIEKNKNAEYPLFHATGGVGWINDPNGFSLYKGEYHLFYQYHPYSYHWGPMHWGHVKTQDFIKWERLPVALAPDEEYDGEGCISGSAVETADGRHLLLYTGVKKETDETGKEKIYQQQCLAIGDGTDYTKWEGNPVIPTAMIPSGNSTADFRDPKIWLEGGKYHAVVGNRMADSYGAILSYESPDAKTWEYRGILDKSDGQYGKMWECPDFFRLSGKAVLMANPQEMTGMGTEFHPGNNSAFIVGKSEDSGSFEREGIFTVDYGTDFYAPQTLLTADGRRVMISWMQNWDTSNYGNESNAYFGEMTIPRTLEFKSNRIYQNPVEEITRYYGKKTEIKRAEIKGKKQFDGLSGRALDLTLTLHGPKGAAVDGSMGNFTINLAESEQEKVSITYEAHRGMLELDRSQSGVRSDQLNYRRFPIEAENGAIKLRILMDYHSVEIFVNDGAKAASMKIYSPLSATGISFEAEKCLEIDLESYDLEEKLSK